MSKEPITSRVIRPGQRPSEENDWRDSTPAERIEAVWTLTKLCLAWTTDDPDEPRLQRSVSRVQRTWR